MVLLSNRPVILCQYEYDRRVEFVSLPVGIFTVIMSDLKETIKRLSEEFFQEVVEIRRHLHRHPELSGKEYETAAFIRRFLENLGISNYRPMADTGIVGLVEGKNPSVRCIAIRADMDALPIQEENTVEYRSEIEGVMHACGHDVHMAVLLGVIKILHRMKDEFEGTVKFIFQPSEEYYPGGALRMIQEGVLENPRPSHVFGLHVLPELEVGKAGFREGYFMASTDEIHLTIQGRGGHAAMPWNITDTVLIASHIVVALQQIVSRQTPPDKPTVLSFGRFIADGMANIIPDSVVVSGTLRTFDEEWRNTLHERISLMARQVARSMNGDCETKILKGYPALYNDPGITSRARSWAEEFLGAENVVNLRQRMTADDFAYFARQVPSCYLRLGTGNPAGRGQAVLHSPTFDVDEKSLKYGMGLMAWIALRSLVHES